MPHIVCLRPLHPDAMARLHAEPDFKVTMLTEVNADTLREPMKTAEAIIVRATPINRDFLANAPMLAGGISKALITTAAGLMVAIPALFFHRYLQRRIDELVVGMEQEAIKLVEVVQGDRDVDLGEDKA